MDLLPKCITCCPSNVLISADPFINSHFDGKLPSVSLLGLSWKVWASVLKFTEHIMRAVRKSFAFILIYF
jgi:hypothetical protein